ncbi:MAG: hypothetical protein J6X34_06160, partial [Clostridia bacterium]|nr:hypothetical protein [Clostridia bacterium]
PFGSTFTCKEPLLSTNNIGGFLLYFGRKSDTIKQIKQNRVPAWSISFAETRSLYFKGKNGGVLFAFLYAANKS